MGPGNRQQGDREVFDASGFVRRVGEFIDSSRLIPPQAKVLAGVSGGADSVALLAILHELAESGGRHWALSVAHLNHCLRDDADADEQFVRQLAEKLGLPCHVETRDVAAEAAEAGKTVEEAGRDARMEFFAATAAEQGIPCVAVGHHADDNVETVLHRIFRGTHLRGLAGIPASRRLGGGVQLIRPLLNFRRSEVEQFCTERKLDWCDDETNTDVQYRRNFIRHDLLPLLRDKLNPRVDEAIMRLASSAGAAEDYLELQARAVFKDVSSRCEDGLVVLAAELVALQPRTVRIYLLRLAAELAGVPFKSMSTERLDELADITEPGRHATVQLPGGFTASLERRSIVIISPEQRNAPGGKCVELPTDGQTEVDRAVITCRTWRLKPDEFTAHCRSHPAGVELLDADKLQLPLTCRSRQDGDRFNPLGSDGSQSVSDFLTNLKISSLGRRGIRCICDSKGIVYLAPLRIDERVKVTEKTRRVLRIDASDLVV